MVKILDDIKYEGDNKTFVWKHPTTDFNTASYLTVNASQEALFYMNGQALDLFGPGRHTLKTQNIPLIRNLMSLPTGGVTPFHCEVYFINKVEQLAIKWGTSSKVQYMDPEYGFPLSIGVSGEMSLRIEDSRKLLVKVVGTETELGQERLAEYFRMFLDTRVKSHIARVMQDKAISIFEVDARLEDFTVDLHSLLKPDFADYGTSLERFFVTNIVKPDGDPQYEEFKALHFRQFADVKDAEIRQNVGVIEQETEAKKTVIEAGAAAQKRQIEGYTYQQERGFDVAEKVAENEGVGEFSNMGIGLGMVAGVGGGVGTAVGGVVNTAMGAVAQPGGILGGALASTDGAGGQAITGMEGAGQARFCENCGEQLALGAGFCEECGTAVPANTCSNPECGAVFTRPGKFCPGCGAKREV
ncbi:MAG: SPFH domain-containing protein [Clostridiales bacterium]|nr:SPFH domain-containing protein [Clostridiales bacterium]